MPPVDRADLQDAIRTAREAAERAYAPYSNFRVGAAILTRGGALHAGCNVENASFGLTICAERNAAFRMAYADPDDRKIETVVVTSPDGPAFPCGACRQVLREFGCEEVVVLDADGTTRRFTFEEILPHSFGPGSLP
jgi:cytidine deaminase